MDERTQLRHRRTETGEPDGMDMFHDWTVDGTNTRRAYSRVNYQVADTPQNRAMETEAFIRRKEKW